MHTITRTGARCWLVAVAAVAAAPALSAPALLAQSPAASQPSPTVTPALADTAQVPVILYEEDIVAWVDEPDEHLMRARAALAAHDKSRAAEEVAAAAAFVRVQAATAQGVDKGDLVEAGRDLDRTASEIRRGTIRTPGELDRALQRTDDALARHHLARAQAAWDHKEVAKAGHELRGAARYTERLARDTGRDVERGTRGVVHDTQRLGSRMVDGAGWTVGEVGKGFDSLKRALDRLGGHVAPQS